MWGRGEYGRLGLGDKSGSSKLRPTLVQSISGERWVCKWRAVVLRDDAQHVKFSRR